MTGGWFSAHAPPPTHAYILGKYPLTPGKGPRWFLYQHPGGFVSAPRWFCISTPVVLYQKPGNDMYQDPDKISAQDPYFFVSGPRGLSHKESRTTKMSFDFRTFFLALIKETVKLLLNLRCKRYIWYIYFLKISWIFFCKNWKRQFIFT